MLDTLFLQILNMSLTASFVILFVLIARVLLRKAPKIFSYTLWAVVLFRLLCPISIEGIWSVIPVNQTAISTDVIYAEIPKVDTGIQILDNQINPVLQGQGATTYASANPMQIWVSIGEMIWLLGILILIGYSVVSLLKLHKKLVGAVKLERNIYLADHVESPFVIGVLFPQIYLPSSLPVAERAYIILHEECHIRRLDHVMKLLAFLALCLHWFNPLVWVAFVLSTQDMEMSCDEAVMKKMDGDIRGEYSASLLSLATGKRIIMGTPLAFGEGDTTGRIKNVLGYKKAKKWVIGIALVAVVGIGVSLLGNNQRYDTMDVVFSDFPLSKIFFEDGEISVGREHWDTYQLVSKIEVSKKEVDEDTALLDRGVANGYVYGGGGDLSRTITTSLNFSEDYSMVWLHDDMVTSDTHRVKYPEKVKAIFQESEWLAPGFWASDLYEARTPYVGDAPAVGNIIHMLAPPVGLTYDHFSLDTEWEPYGIAVVFTGHEETYQQYESGEISTEQIQRIAYLLLALVENLGSVDVMMTDEYGENQLIYRYYREDAEELLGRGLQEFAEDPLLFQELLWDDMELYDAKIEELTNMIVQDSPPLQYQIGAQE